SIYRGRKLLEKASELSSISIPCCPKYCMAYTGVFENIRECFYCNSSRTTAAKFDYIPIMNQLINEIKNSKQRRVMRYRHEKTFHSPNENGTYEDIFDGKHYRSLVERGFFVENREDDVALLFATDGYSLYKL
ncbi:hypothetical protein BC829DRAFT_362019, partial [Chytridium lagenaria]